MLVMMMVTLLSTLLHRLHIRVVAMYIFTKIHFQKDDEAYGKALVVFGANDKLRNHKGQTPIHLATGNFAKVLSSFAGKPTPDMNDVIRVLPDTKQGGRVLFLDSGGVRGLILVEMLIEIERRTGRKITELFDWFVGTSIGSVVAAGLVYGELPTHVT